MAVPKKRTGSSAQGHRRANWKATKPEVTKCSHCGETVLTHTVCTACGYYKGKAASIKSPDYVESTLDKKVKKSPVQKVATKKVESKTEEKVENLAETTIEETVENEVKEEEKTEDNQ